MYKIIIESMCVCFPQVLGDNVSHDLSPLLPQAKKLCSVSYLPLTSTGSWTLSSFIRAVAEITVPGTMAQQQLLKDRSITNRFSRVKCTAYFCDHNCVYHRQRKLYLSDGKTGLLQ